MRERLDAAISYCAGLIGIFLDRLIDTVALAQALGAWLGVLLILVRLAHDFPKAYSKLGSWLKPKRDDEGSAGR